MAEKVRSAYSPQKWICIFTGVMVIFCFKYVPPFAGLEKNGMDILGIFIGTIFLWLTVSTTWTSLLPLIAISMNPLYTYSSVTAGSWGNWVVPFIIFALMCSEVLADLGFLKRVAIYFISRPAVKKGPWIFILYFFGAALIIGCIMEPMTLFIVLLSVAEEVFRQVGWRKGDKGPAMIVMGLMITTALASAMTPVAHVFVVLSMSRFATDTGSTISFFSSSVAGIITGVGCFLIMLGVFKFIYKPDLSPISNIDVASLEKELPPMSKREKLSLLIFGLVVLLWFAPSFLNFIWPAAATWLNRMGTLMPALLGVILFSLIKIDDKPMLEFGKAMKSVPWAAVNLAASTQIIASAMSNPEIGLSAWLTNIAEPLVGNMSGMVYVIVVALVCGLTTNFISCSVCVTMFYGLFMPVVLVSGATLGINAAALAFVIGAASSLAFGAPSGRAHAALAAGTGWFSLRDMLIFGTGLSVIMSLMFALIGYPIGSLIM